MYRNNWIDNHFGAFIVLTIVFALIITFGAAWFGSSMEARSYRKFCDTPVTTWDALFLDLRIDEC